ncbi:S26 family signal peptidase [Streptomyces sp. NPDC056627]|uniref:S26 family signal peptidase n=1 Tax=Streptomyces sp. NPDC056627 TaxID=3345881 RepID=UPI0036B4D981
MGCSGSSPVKVNGEAMDDSFIHPGNTPCGDEPFGPVKVPKGRMRVMGDHRQDSQNSRYHQDQPGGGTIGEDQVIGRAFVVVGRSTGGPRCRCRGNEPRRPSRRQPRPLRFLLGRGACRFRARTGGDSRGTEVRRGAARPTLLEAGNPRSCR